MNPSPILLMRGKVHSVQDRPVEPVPARPESRDEAGNLLQTALPARDGYNVVDVTVLTSDLGGGFTTAALLPAALAALGGELPNPGDDVEYAVRPYIKWEGRPGSKRPYIRFSVAGEETARLRQDSTGRRVAAVS